MKKIDDVTVNNVALDGCGLSLNLNFSYIIVITLNEWTEYNFTNRFIVWYMSNVYKKYIYPVPWRHLVLGDLSGK